MVVFFIPVDFVGIDGAGPGLASLMKAVADRVSYTVGETMSARKPIFSPLSVIFIDAGLEEIWYILSTRVPYIDIPTIRITTGCGKDSTSLSTTVGIMEGSGREGGSVGRDMG